MKPKLSPPNTRAVRPSRREAVTSNRRSDRLLYAAAWYAFAAFYLAMLIVAVLCLAWVATELVGMLR